MARRVVVTGLGLICGVGNTSVEVWKNIVAGKSGVSRIASFDASNFACQIAAEVRNFDPLNFIEKKEIKKMARFIHPELLHDDLFDLLFYCCWHTLLVSFRFPPDSRPGLLLHDRYFRASCREQSLIACSRPVFQADTLGSSSLTIPVSFPGTDLPGHVNCLV